MLKFNPFTSNFDIISEDLEPENSIYLAGQYFSTIGDSNGASSFGSGTFNAGSLTLSMFLIRENVTIDRAQLSATSTTGAASVRIGLYTSVIGANGTYTPSSLIAESQAEFILLASTAATMTFNYSVPFTVQRGVYFLAYTIGNANAVLTRHSVNIPYLQTSSTTGSISLFNGYSNTVSYSPLPANYTGSNVPSLLIPPAILFRKQL